MTRTTANRPTVGRHRTDMVSLVAGVLFLGVVGTWVMARIDWLNGLRGWLLPILLVGLGLIGLIGIRPRRSADGPTTPGESAAEPALPEHDTEV